MEIIPKKMNIIEFLTSVWLVVLVYLGVVFVVIWALRNWSLNVCYQTYLKWGESPSFLERLSSYIYYKKKESGLIAFLGVLFHVALFFLLAILDVLWERKVFPFVFLISSLGVFFILGVSVFWFKRVLWVFFKNKESVMLMVFGSYAKIQYFQATKKLP